MSANLPPVNADGPLLPWLLAALSPMSRTRVKELLGSGRVAVNDAPVTRHDHPLRPGDRVTLGPVRPAIKASRAVSIVFEDDSLVAIDKPAGLLTVATDAEKRDTAFSRLADQMTARRAGRVFVVHRLDRDTSGLLLFARSAEVRDKLQEGWEGVTKLYLAVTEGIPRPAEGVVENVLAEGENLTVRPTRADDPNGRKAVTRFRVVGGEGKFALVEVELLTGRKHQIRAHLAGLGCPVIGDVRYGAKKNPAGRLGLHAWRLGFPHPVGGARVELESALPNVLRRVTRGE